VAFDITATRLDDQAPELIAFLAPLDGTPGLEARLGRLQAGRRTYSAAVACAAGCRLTQLQVDLPHTAGPTVELTWHNPPTRDWRSPPDGTVAAAADGVAFTMHAGGRRDAGLLRPAGLPDRIPVLPAAPLPPDGLVDTFDNTTIPVTAVAIAHTLPRLGAHGTLIDLEYADRLAGDSGTTDGAEVWLTPDAPQSIVDALTVAGLTITGERTAADERRLLGRSGGALGMRFSLLAGVAAVLLGAAGLVATALGVSRSDLVALRRQGVPARVTRRVEPAATLALVIVALGAGAVAAAVAWIAIGRFLPGVDAGTVPPLRPLLLALSGAAGVLGLSALLRDRLGSG
jgi:putative ABC transport system permease protein